jgi:glutamate synthase (NADPH/NADH) large chain
MLVTAAVHHYLIKRGLRALCDLVVETGDVRETHHFATVIGYGASAVNAYLIEEMIVDLQAKKRLPADKSVDDIFASYKKAIDAGLLKIFSKMGISTIQSYQGAQIFEALGISKAVVDKYFKGTVTRIQGLSIDDIANEILVRHRFAYPLREVPVKRLDVGGVYQWKQNGEKHLFNPTTIPLLQQSTRNKNYEQFKEYCDAVDAQGDDAATLRSQFDFVANANGPISIDDVEPAENIL